METVFAVGILLLGLGAAVTLVASSVQSSQKNKDTIVVTNLAREALEIVRSVRDGAQTGQGFGSLTEGVWVIDADTTTFDISSTTLTPAVPAVGVGVPAHIRDCTNCELVFLGGKYVTSAHSGGSSTSYARMVEIIDAGVYEKRITATVSWTEKGRTHEYTLETELWNWK